MADTPITPDVGSLLITAYPPAARRQPLTMPNYTDFTRVRITLGFNTRAFMSPVNRARQTVELTGARWEIYYEVQPGVRADADAWLAFLARLKGRVGLFYGIEPSKRTARGIATGTPLVNGAGQTGSSLITDGWTTSQTGILLAGDLIAFDVPSGARAMHMVAEDVDSDGSGNAVIPLEPIIRESPADNATIIVTDPTCTMALLDDTQLSYEVEPPGHYYMSFIGVEAFWQ